ncbi:formin-mediated actin nucleation enhancer TDEL_0D03170 [Torulaspora delbrueckii]|uniref:Actin interacting protein 3 C-terminal domain-containing protein n=1 Tax=Torulaspora delbrueckii TaxID=4950 RepID=G8ZTF7_TORDE|nr:hypothetical protein TDEL_0D03170 [Torulaspora delbrueckii]CCE91901.1 hypothetical protein TDEL_0D03170 [Torulaspora delbrueckii]
MSSDRRYKDGAGIQQDRPLSKRNSSVSSSSSRSTATSVETIVTKLLMSTKHLLQTLTQWSRMAVTEKSVSNAYVQLGNDFKVVSKFFTHCGIDVRDLGDVPLDLRRVLEVALREKPSDNNLNKYLPTIREIIVTLLDKLKVKQAMLKSMKHEQLVKETQHQQRPSIVSSLALSSTSTPTRSSNPNITTTPSVAPEVPKRETSQKDSLKNETGRSAELLTPTRQRTLSENEALSRLKHGSNLQRRASKRFSAYHMAKFTNQSTTEAAAAAVASVPSSAQSNPLPCNLSADTSDKTPESSPRQSLPKSDTKLISRLDNGAVYTLFLTMDGKTKKCTLPRPTSMNALKLLFVEKFAYSPGGEDFPNLYMKDPKYGVFYELDEQGLLELCDGCVIELRRQQHDDSVSNQISGMIEQLRNEISKSQENLLNQVRSLTIQSQQPNTSNTTIGKESHQRSTTAYESLLQLKQEVSVMRQLQRENKTNVESTIATITEKLSKFRTLSLSPAASSNRAYMDKSQSQLGEESDALLSRVDDLQDLIEILRKDVAARGAKPSKKKLESVQKDLKAAQEDLQKMKQYIVTEKPHWKKIWEAELDKVCEEQQFLTLQEDLAADLDEDLGKALETFDLVSLCCAEQEKNPKRSKTAPILPIPKPGTLNVVRDQLLVEVQSLNPDHESRVEALERAEKLWLKEREYRDNGEFEEELGHFVEKSSFKRSGGVEEVERLRRQKDEENLRANFGGLA